MIQKYSSKKRKIKGTVTSTGLSLDFKFFRTFDFG
jgi:hypothetical protein